jgi:hypothetical protein
VAAHRPVTGEAAYRPAIEEDGTGVAPPRPVPDVIAAAECLPPVPNAVARLRDYRAACPGEFLGTGIVLPHHREADSATVHVP